MERIERTRRRTVLVALMAVVITAALTTTSAASATSSGPSPQTRPTGWPGTAPAVAVGPAWAAAGPRPDAVTVVSSGDAPDRADPDRVAVSAAGPVGGAALTAVGQLLADDHACTAAVVASSSGMLAVTAAHCVYVPAPTERMPDIAQGRERGWVDEAVFVPARSGDDAPHGVWEVERMWVDRAWQDHATPEVDVAFLQLRDAPTGAAPSGTAQEVLGALGMRFDTDTDTGDGDGDGAPAIGGKDAGQADAGGTGGTSGAGPTVDVLGYPTVAPFDGTRLRRCDQVPTDPSWAGLLETRCPLTLGASGGPWVLPDRGWWSVVAITSYLSQDRPGALGGVRLGALAERLWRAADQAAQR